MRRVRVDDVAQMDENQGLRILTDPLGATAMAINRYELSPGGRIGGYHAHHDQEELFYVLSGVLTVETEEGDVEVGPDEAVHFARGEFHFGYNAMTSRWRCSPSARPQTARRSSRYDSVRDVVTSSTTTVPPSRREGSAPTTPHGRSPAPTARLRRAGSAGRIKQRDSPLPIRLPRARGLSGHFRC